MNHKIDQEDFTNELTSREANLSNQAGDLEQKLKDLLFEYRKYVEQKKIEQIKRQLGQL